MKDPQNQRFSPAEFLYWTGHPTICGNFTESEVQYHLRWRPASGHPSGWRVTRGISPLQEYENPSGSTKILHSIEAAQTVANELNAENDPQGTPEVWPVIHVSKGNLELVTSNAKMALRAGCDGVFLISMEGHDGELIDFAKKTQARFPQLKVGVNHLTLPASESLKLNLEANLPATWTDSPGISSQEATEEAAAIRSTLLQNRTHLFFGSVAFKYQRTDKNPGAAALRALDHGMIPTTSGSETGKAAKKEKLEAIRGEIWKNPLAIASGVTPKNAADHKGIVTHILVATGIAQDFHTFCPEKLYRLMQALK